MTTTDPTKLADAVQVTAAICGQHHDPQCIYCVAAYDSNTDRILRRPTPPPDVAKWQPISTAPKDGTWFVALQNGETYPCEWQVEEPDEGPPHEGWWDHFNRSFEEPTHWQPAALASQDASDVAKAAFDAGFHSGFHYGRDGQHGEHEALPEAWAVFASQDAPSVAGGMVERYRAAGRREGREAAAVEPGESEVERREALMEFAWSYEHEGETCFAVDIEDAIAAWNTRFDTAELERQNAALREAGSELAVALHGFVVSGCNVCGGDCASANPPVIGCPMNAANAAVRKWNRARTTLGGQPS